MMKRFRVAGLAAAVLFFAWAASASDKPLEVVDANGMKIGRFMGAGFYSGMELTVGGKTYVVWPNFQPTYLDFAFIGPYFATADCTGTPYVDTGFPHGTAYAVAMASPSGQVLLWPPADQKSSMVSIMAYLIGNGTCVPIEAGLGPYVPLGEPIDITGRYARPFHVQ